MSNRMNNHMHSASTKPFCSSHTILTISYYFICQCSLCLSVCLPICLYVCLTPPPLPYTHTHTSVWIADSSWSFANRMRQTKTLQSFLWQLQLSLSLFLPLTPHPSRPSSPLPLPWGFNLPGKTSNDPLRCEQTQRDLCDALSWLSGWRTAPCIREEREQRWKWTCSLFFSPLHLSPAGRGQRE